MTNLLDLALNVELWDSEMKWSLQTLMRLMSKPTNYLRPCKFIFGGTIGLPQMWEMIFFLLADFPSGKQEPHNKSISLVTVVLIW